MRAVYHGHERRLCPHRLGRNYEGPMRVLCQQYAGDSRSGRQAAGSPANWRCIAIEKLSEAWFAAFAADLKAQGALVVGLYVCPHGLGEPCRCKKPIVLLYNGATYEHHLTAADCFVIGDSPDDVRAARNLSDRVSRSCRLGERPACGRDGKAGCNCRCR